MALLSACILPSAAIDPEQSATMKKCSGRAANVDPGRSVMTVSFVSQLVWQYRAGRSGGMYERSVAGERGRPAAVAATRNGAAGYRRGEPKRRLPRRRPAER